MIQVPKEREKNHVREWTQVGQAANVLWKAKRLPNVVNVLHCLCSGLQGQSGLEAWWWRWLTNRRRWYYWWDYRCWQETSFGKEKKCGCHGQFSIALMMGMTMGILYRAMTPNWSNGLAYKVVEELKKNYWPQDTLAMWKCDRCLTRLLWKGTGSEHLVWTVVGDSKQIQHSYKADKWVRPDCSGVGCCSRWM